MLIRNLLHGVASLLLAAMTCPAQTTQPGANTRLPASVPGGVQLSARQIADRRPVIETWQGEALASKASVPTQSLQAPRFLAGQAGEGIPLRLRFPAALAGRGIIVTGVRGVEVASMDRNTDFAIAREVRLLADGTATLAVRFPDYTRSCEVHVVVEGVMTIIPVTRVPTNHPSQKDAAAAER